MLEMDQNKRRAGVLWPLLAFELSIICGIPQGSILGPVIFPIYMLSLEQIDFK